MFGPRGPRTRPGATRGGEPARRAPGASVTETVVIEAQPRRRTGTAAATARVAAVRTKPRLVDLASDWLSTVLALAQVPELPDAAAVRARALDLKGRFEAGEQGFTAADVEAAVFAMVAFLDETVLNNRGAAREVWISRPLQLELYGRQLAGEEFFERLEALRHEREVRIEALEVYCCCLAFGFAGRMRLGAPEKLVALLDEVQRDIAAVRGDGRLALAPNAGHRRERAAEEVRGLAWWVPALAFVPAVALVFLVVWLLAWLGAGHAAAAIRGLLAR